MAFKINISDKGKTFKLEGDIESLVGKKIGDKIPGKDIKPDLEGYELEITGTSDKAGFPGSGKIEGSGLKKELLTKGFGMWTKKPKGLRRKKTLRGKVISKDIIQINTKVVKAGGKKLEEVFPKAEEKKEKAPATQPQAQEKEPLQKVEKDSGQESTTEEKKEEEKPAEQ